MHLIFLFSAKTLKFVTSSIHLLWLYLQRRLSSSLVLAYKAAIPLIEPLYQISGAGSGSAIEMFIVANIGLVGQTGTGHGNMTLDIEVAIYVGLV